MFEEALAIDTDEIPCLVDGLIQPVVEARAPDTPRPEVIWSVALVEVFQTANCWPADVAKAATTKGFEAIIEFLAFCIAVVRSELL